MKKLIFLFLLIHSTLLYSQKAFSPPDTRLKARATEIAGSITIDGQLDEQFWQHTDTLTRFIQVEPNQGEASKFVTRVFLLYDDKHLYVGVFCADPEGKKGVRVPDLRRDFAFRSNDTFAVGIDGFYDSRNTITLAVNPYGAQKDYLSFDDVLFDSDWNGLWKVRTSITDKGWYAEFAIPWKTLRYNKLTDEAHSQNWGLNFVRLRRASNEISAWSPYPRAFGFNRAEYFGELEGVEPPAPASNIQAVPYALVSSNQVRRNGFSTRQTDFKQGGEVKWVINPNMVLDASFNTDFAQADADLQVNNVSRFSVFFPERRQFFLENSSLFGTGLLNDDGMAGNIRVIPFFSRRVGLSASGQPIPIDAGLRLVNRNLQSSSGLMAVRQSSFGTEPASYISVGRHVQNIGKQGRLGVLLTSKFSDENTNLVGGLDGFFRMGANQQLSFMALRSQDSDTGDGGFGGYLQYAITNNHLQAWLSQSLIGEAFNPSLGFVSRENVLATSPGIIANLRGKHLPFPHLIRAFKPRLMANWYREASTGDLTERELIFSPFWLEMQAGGELSFSISRHNQYLQTSFSPVGIEIAPSSYTYSRYTASVSTDPSAWLSAKGRYVFGDYYNGALRNLNLSVALVPIPHVSVRLAVDQNEFESVGKFNESKAVTLYTLESRLFLNPRVQLFGLYQHNSAGESDAYNLRLAWEYSPLSYLYLVFNSRKSLGADLLETREQQTIFKVSFLKQF